MKPPLRHRWALFVVCSASAGFSATPDAWIMEPPPKIAAARKIEVPAGDAFEVVASMAEHAKSELRKKTFVAISDQQARKFTGPYYSCPKSKRPFLVRAVAGFAGTGTFHIFRVSDSIWVSHESLGEGFTSSPTAFVVNLDFVPESAYASVSIIE